MAATDPDGSGKFRSFVLAAMAVITLAAFVLRLYDIGSLDLWYDEIVLWFYALTGDAVAVEAPHEPPLMAALLYCMMWWLQDTAPIWSHVLPVVLGTLTVPTAYLLMSRIDSSPATRLIIASLIALSPMAIYFSREARPYALHILVVATLYLMFLRAYADRRASSWGIYGVFLALACLSHLTTSMVVAALGLTALTLLITDLSRPGGWPMARAWFVPFAVSSVLGAVAGSWWILPRRQIAAENGYTFTYTFSGFDKDGPINFLRDFVVNLGPGPIGSSDASWPLNYSELLGLVFVVLFVIGLARLVSRGERAAALLLGLAVVVPAFVLYVTAGQRFGIRYVSHAVVPYLTLVGIGVGAILERLPSRTLKLMLVSALLLAMLPMSLPVPDARPEIGRYRETARYTRTHANELRGVLILPYLITRADADLRITNIYGMLRRDMLPLYHVSFGKIVGVKQVPGSFGFGTVLVEEASGEITMPSGRYAVLSRRPFDDCRALAESLLLKPEALRSEPIVEGLTVCDFEFKSGQVRATPPG